MTIVAVGLLVTDATGRTTTRNEALRECESHAFLCWHNSGLSKWLIAIGYRARPEDTRTCTGREDGTRLEWAQVATQRPQAPRIFFHVTFHNGETLTLVCVYCTYLYA